MTINNNPSLTIVNKLLERKIVFVSKKTTERICFPFQMKKLKKIVSVLK